MALHPRRRRQLRAAVTLLLSSLAAPAALVARAAPAGWPPLDEQLRAAGARPGSRLAATIRANQELWLLPLAELDGTRERDVRGLPAWLRVAFRKAHPDFDPDGTASTYPLILRDMHEALLREPGASGGHSPRDAEDTGGADSKVVVLVDHAMSSLPSSQLRESDVRIDPWSPNRVIAASNNSTTGKQAVYWSDTAGLIWKQTSLPLKANLGDQVHSDPTVDWTSDGVAWSTTIGLDLDNFVAKGRVYRSTDGGKSWTFDSTFSGGQDLVDKQMVAVDHSSASPRLDTMYAIWRQSTAIYFARRPPGGSWSAPKKLSGAESSDWMIGADVEVDAAGDVVVFWATSGPRKIISRRSTDGGGSFSPAVAVASTFGAHDIGVPAIANRRALIYVAAGSHRTATKNLAYAAWTDLSGKPGCDVPGAEPNDKVGSNCKSRIRFARSTDGGASWLPAILVHDPAEHDDQFHPALAVDPTNGTLALTYHDTTGDVLRTKTHVWYQASYDDGVTWSAPTQVSSAATDEAEAFAGFNQYGDYNGLSAHDRVLVSSWTDRRGGGSEEIWAGLLEEPRTDVWMQDKPWDSGLEPDPATATDPMWESEDLWVRNDGTPGEHQNPIFGKTNHVHALVRNRAQTKAENVPVKLYWAKSSAGLAWPQDWTPIGTAIVPEIAAGAGAEIDLPWDPPGLGHYCLLARLDTAQDPMAAEEIADQVANTQLNNNVAWKNVVVVTLIEWKFQAIDVLLANGLGASATVKIGIEDRLERGVPRPFLDRGRLTLAVDPELVRRWREGGASGRGIRLLDDRTFEIVDGRAELFVRLEPGERFPSELRFEDLEATGGERIERHAVAIAESIVDTRGERELGGVTYTIEAPVR